MQRKCPQTRPAENQGAIIGSHRMVDNGGYTYIYIYIMYIYVYIYMCVCMARFSERGGVPEIPSAKLTSQKHEQMISLLTLLQSLPPRQTVCSNSSFIFTSQQPSMFSLNIFFQKLKNKSENEIATKPINQLKLHPLSMTENQPLFGPLRKDPPPPPFFGPSYVRWYRRAPPGPLHLRSRPKGFDDSCGLP